MTKRFYRSKRFRLASFKTIEQANSIIAEYQAIGFLLTLRQLYYQFVARGLIPNRDSEYDKLGSIISDGRLAGLIDWDAIEDRTRNLKHLAHWSSPQQIITACASQYQRDLWENQPYRPEVWIEKEALVGIIEAVCNELDIPYFAARGYNSQTEQEKAGQRFVRYMHNDQKPIVFHLGDHDPSGLDMTRDNLDRLDLFTGGVPVQRLALNLDQIRQYNPPPNPAKLTDSRYLSYMALYGEESWELDALEPQVIAQLIRDAIDGVRDQSRWTESMDQSEREKVELQRIADNWNDVQGLLRGPRR